MLISKLCTHHPVKVLALQVIIVSGISFTRVRIFLGVWKMPVIFRCNLTCLFSFLYFSIFSTPSVSFCFVFSTSIIQSWEGLRKLLSDWPERAQTFRTVSPSLHSIPLCWRPTDLCHAWSALLPKCSSILVNLSVWSLSNVCIYWFISWLPEFCSFYSVKLIGSFSAPWHRWLQCLHIIATCFRHWVY